MRILVISDSHGRNDDVSGVIRQVGPIDTLIHCGDVERGDDYIRSLVDCPAWEKDGMEKRMIRKETGCRFWRQM